MVRLFEESWPLVVALVHGELTDTDVEEMISVYERIHAREERFFLVQETRTAKLPTAVMRKKLADMNTRFAADIERHVIGVGVIVSSVIASGVLSAIFWVTQKQTKIFSATSGEETLRRASELCNKEDVVLPPDAARFLRDLDAAALSPGGLERLLLS